MYCRITVFLGDFKGWSTEWNIEKNEYVRKTQQLSDTLQYMESWIIEQRNGLETCVGSQIKTYGVRHLPLKQPELTEASNLATYGVPGCSPFFLRLL